MFTNLFSKCPKCGESINSGSTKCSKCKIEIKSSFGVEKDFYSDLFLELAEKNNIISKNEAEIIYNEYKSLLNTEYPQKIEEILLSQEKTDIKTISKLIAAALRIIDKNFCREAVKKGLITKNQALEALSIQKKLFKNQSLKSAADILKEKDHLNDSQIKEILSTVSITKPDKDEDDYKPLTKLWQEEDKKMKIKEIKNKISPKNLKICELGIKYKFFSAETIEKYAFQWAKDPLSKDLDFIDFIETKGLIDKKKRILLNIHCEYQNLKKSDIEFLKLGILYKFITKKNAEAVFKKQNSIFKEQYKLIPVCKILYNNNLITKSQIKEILSEQNRKGLAQKLKSDPDLINENSSTNKKSEENPLNSGFASKEEIQIEISNDSMKALLYPLPKKIKVEDIKSVLAEKGVQYGVLSDDLIQVFINKNPDTPIEVASGSPPVEPVNSEIKCHFSQNYLNVGSVDEQGNIDFMDRGEIPVAEPGQLLAEKIPLKNGKNGLDIFGNPILVEEAQDCLIEAGQGTRLDETENKIYAIEKGQPHISIDGKVSVFNTHEIKGDVDFNTGHIEFDGNIIIHGSIKLGFRVSANDITAESAMDAIIKSRGQVEIKNGINGGKIFAQQGLSAKFTNQAEITACGNVNIEKEILESKIKTSGLVTVKSGRIISSLVSAKGGIDSRHVGTEVSTPSIIEIGKDSYLEKILAPYLASQKNIDSEINNLKEEIALVYAKEKQSHIEIAKKAQVQDKASQALKQLREHYELVSGSVKPKTVNEIKSKIDELSLKIKNTEKTIDSLFQSQDEYKNILSKHSSKLKTLEENKIKILGQIESIKNYDNSIEPSPVLIVHGTIEKGTKIFGPNSVWEVNETSKNIRISEITTTDEAGNKIYFLKKDKNNK